MRRVRADLGARRRLLVLVEALDLVRGEIELDAALGDRPHALRRHVASPEEAGRDDEPVEDVLARVADELLHRPTWLPSLATTSHPRSITSQDTGSLTAILR